MTDFSRRVYKVVLNIPLGQVRSYKWIAKKAGSPKAYRAVGTILKKNPFPILIPCHRVVKSNNVLGGYIFGKKNKQMILDLERQIRECLVNNG
jgi:methylated-DNA-[protein]-cysteine S-methyltransferase